LKKSFLLGFSKRVIVFCFLRTFEEIVTKGLLMNVTKGLLMDVIKGVIDGCHKGVIDGCHKGGY